MQLVADVYLGVICNLRKKTRENNGKKPIRGRWCQLYSPLPITCGYIMLIVATLKTNILGYET
jgi:hypothetical protein